MKNKLLFRIRLLLFPKYMLENAFRYGIMYGSQKCIMDQGIIKHSPDKQKEILEKMSFNSKYYDI